MSVLPPIADIVGRNDDDARFVPKANACAESTTGLAAPLERFSGSHIGRGRPGEDLEEDAPRYESVVVDEKAEDEADAEYQYAQQKRVDDGAIGIVVLQARYHHGSQD